MEAVGYLVGGKFYPLQVDEKGWFYFSNDYYPVTADNIRQGSEHPIVVTCIQGLGGSRGLQGARFTLELPPTGLPRQDRLTPIQVGESEGFLRGNPLCLL